MIHLSKYHTDPGVQESGWVWTVYPSLLQETLPEELSVKCAPALALPCQPGPFHHSILTDHLCQPVPASIAHDVIIHEYQLTLGTVEPVVVGVCNGHTSLKAWYDRRVVS